MAEQEAPAAVEPAEQAEQTTSTPDLASEVEKWKSLSRKNEQQAKANAAAARRLEEIENASKSEAERLTARAEAAEKLASEHESRALRLEVASEKGLTPAQAKRLVGNSRDELEADADEILRDFPPPTKRPSGDVDQGTRGKPAPKSPADVFGDFIKNQLPH
jgi:hypothetical protein